MGDTSIGWFIRENPNLNGWFRGIPILGNPICMYNPVIIQDTTSSSSLLEELGSPAGLDEWPEGSGGLLKYGTRIECHLRELRKIHSSKMWMWSEHAGFTKSKGKIRKYWELSWRTLCIFFWWVSHFQTKPCTVSTKTTWLFVVPYHWQNLSILSNLLNMNCLSQTERMLVDPWTKHNHTGTGQDLGWCWILISFVLHKPNGVVLEIQNKVWGPRPRSSLDGETIWRFPTIGVPPQSSILDWDFPF